MYPPKGYVAITDPQPQKPAHILSKSVFLFVLFIMTMAVLHFFQAMQKGSMKTPEAAVGEPGDEFLAAQTRYTPPQQRPPQTAPAPLKDFEEVQVGKPSWKWWDQIKKTPWYTKHICTGSTCARVEKHQCGWGEDAFQRVNQKVNGIHPTQTECLGYSARPSKPDPPKPQDTHLVGHNTDWVWMDNKVYKKRSQLEQKLFTDFIETITFWTAVPNDKIKGMILVKIDPDHTFILEYDSRLFRIYQSWVASFDLKFWVDVGQKTWYSQKESMCEPEEQEKDQIRLSKAVYGSKKDVAMNEITELMAAVASSVHVKNNLGFDLKTDGYKPTNQWLGKEGLALFQMRANVPQDIQVCYTYNLKEAKGVDVKKEFQKLQDLKKSEMLKLQRSKSDSELLKSNDQPSDLVLPTDDKSGGKSAMAAKPEPQPSPQRPVLQAGLAVLDNDNKFSTFLGKGGKSVIMFFDGQCRDELMTAFEQGAAAEAAKSKEPVRFGYVDIRVNQETFKKISGHLRMQDGLPTLTSFNGIELTTQTVWGQAEELNGWLDKI